MMIVKPKIRGFICTTAHPLGCRANVEQQIEYVKQQGPINGGPKRALIIGASTGYGLATRIVTAFGCRADTLGIYFEKAPEANRTASPGWYNSKALEEAARKENLLAESINGDAFSDEIKQQAIDLIRQKMGPLDLVVYSLASPRRTHPKTGYIAKSVLKPINQSVSSKTLDTDKAEIKEITLEPASEQEISDTVSVMGGEDWEMWIEALDQAGLLAEGCQTISYTYLGDKLTWPIYGKAAIGKAKEDLDRAVRDLNKRLAKYKGAAYVAAMKAIVTQASSAIPIMPLYISLLYKVMKEKGVHEGAIEQAYRLFSTQLYGQKEPMVDEANRFRLDDWELRPDIQRQVEALWEEVTTSNLNSLSDFNGYKSDFLKLFGFGLPSINYEQEVKIDE